QKIDSLFRLSQKGSFTGSVNIFEASQSTFVEFEKLDSLKRENSKQLESIAQIKNKAGVGKIQIERRKNYGRKESAITHLQVAIELTR
ncbi:MAG: hypothetical protein ACKO96_41475, partial [Flammeovirgaceae bacterium]